MKLSSIFLCLFILSVIAACDGSSSEKKDEKPNNTVFLSQTIINKRYFKDGDTIQLVVYMNSADCTVSADFSPVDSEYSEGDETVVNVGGGEFQISYTISAPASNSTLDDDNIDITVTASDSNSNTNTDIASGKNAFLHLDNSNPIITVNSLTTRDATPIISGTITERCADSISITIDGTTYTNGATYGYNAIQITGTESPYTWKLSDEAISSLSAGTYDVTVNVTDMTGNSANLTIAGAIEIVNPSGNYVGNLDDAILDVENTQIVNCSSTMEYCINSGAWVACTSSAQTIAISNGDVISIRQSDAPAIVRNLGIAYTTVTLGDLVVGDNYIGEIYGSNYYRDITAAAPGDTVCLNTFIKNNSSNSFTWQGNVKYYFSADKELDTAEDILVYDTGLVSWAADPMEESDWNTVITEIPETITPGQYFLIVKLDTVDASTEYSVSNNISVPSKLATVTISDEDEQLADGAFKVVNSWGEGGSWENVSDGHYWITYEAMKNQKFYVYYYKNDFKNAYDPKALVSFHVTGGYRDETLVTLQLKNRNTSEIMAEKELQVRWNSELKSGHFTFNNDFVMDITEFSSLLDSCNVEVNVDNQSASSSTIINIELNLYSSYGGAAIRTCSASNITVSSGNSGSRIIDTTLVTASDILAISPPAMSIASNPKLNLIEKTPDSSDVDKYILRNGIVDERKNYNDKNIDGFGTGLKPLSEEELLQMDLLEQVDSATPNSLLPNTIDWSASNYFPPVGSQGSEGSCVAWSVGYYIHTYYEAKEHNWDLSGTTVNGSFLPTSNLDKIFSPDFIYHQINSGIDSGSSYLMAGVVVTRLGCATWDMMPYNTADWTSWPSQAAWENAVQYRGTFDSNNFWEFLETGCLIIENDDDIKQLKQLIANGYLVSISVRAGGYGATPLGVYDLLDSNDVFNDTTQPIMDTNHANTIVGYKEGAAWNINDPEN